MDAGNDEARLRVSDAEREATVSRLSTATGEGRLTLEEFGERASQAYGARTRGELARLVDDLPAPVPVPAAGSEMTRPAAGAAVARQAMGAGGTISRVRQRSVQFSPVGSIRRGGRWRLDGDAEVTTVVGSVKLDLRGAEVAAPEVELQVTTVVGSVKVWIPHGVRVEVEGTTYVGSRRIEEESGGGFTDAPVLRLRLSTVVGSVKVYRV